MTMQDTTTELPKRRQADKDTQVIVGLLTDIHQQNERIEKRFDALESRVSKKAVMYGAVSGGVTASIVEVGIELIKAKFGG